MCHTPSPYNESEPSRHYPFVQAHGSKKAYDADNYALLHVRRHTHTCSFRGHCFYLNGFHFSYVCRPVSPCGALPPLFFMQSIISIQSLFARSLENPGADDPCGQVDLTPEAKIGLPPLPKIKMTPVDIEPPGDFICIFGFRFGRRGIKPKKHEYKVKKHSPVSRIGNGNKKHQQCF